MINHGDNESDNGDYDGDRNAEMIEMILIFGEILGSQMNRLWKIKFVVVKSPQIFLLPLSLII